MRLPDRVAVMTLPGTLLFPQAMLPLYIFEEKYRTMLRAALDGQRMFAIALARARAGNDGPWEPHDVAGVGLIRACVDNPDGTSHLVLQGLARVRLHDISAESPYRTAHPEVITSTNTKGAEVESLMEQVSTRAVRRTRRIAEVPEKVIDFLAQLKDPDALADLVTYTLIEDAEVKQRLLATADVRRRLHALIPLLD
jgi:Lon protease-like protein